MNARTIQREEDTEMESYIDFRKVMVALALIASVIAGVVYVVNSPKKITIDEKHWACTDTEPNGIEAECTNFSKKKPFGLRAQ